MRHVRKIVFWAHLTSGIAAALVIGMMSVTGVLLTYERQMLAWADRSLRHDSSAGQRHLPLEALVAAARLQNPGFEPTSITVSADPADPVKFSAGRSGTVFVDRFSSRSLADGAPRLRAFFAAMTGWHRWFNISGEGRGAARAITGACNLIFLFLILSGLYLWLPRTVSWAAFRTRLIFSRSTTTSKARDLNWHHVFGIWSLIPLAAVVATAVVFSYGWANDLVYRAFDEEPPGRSRPSAESFVEAYDRASRLRLDQLAAAAAATVPGWRHLTMPMPDGSKRIEIAIDSGNGGQPQYRHNVVVSADTGAIETHQTFAGFSPGRRTRLFVRYLHTGEALGIAGQTVAGIVSLTSIIMIWTGLALAYRRLIAPLLRRRSRHR